MSKLPLVRDFMTKNLVTLAPDMDINEAMHKMIRQDVSGAPVVNGDGSLIGMLSEKDCMRVFASAAFGNDYVPTGKVSDYMVAHPETTTPESDIFALASVFMHRHYRRLPVVENGKVVGIVSRPDVLRVSLELWEHPDGRKWSDSKYLSDDLKAVLKS